MPTFEYECEQCGLRFERFQKMSDDPVRICPECGGQVKKLISGGCGHIFKNSASGPAGFDSKSPAAGCGRSIPCCGRDIPCEKSPKSR